MVTDHAVPLDDLEDGPDLLDELMEEGTRQDPDFPALTDAAYARMALMHRLGEYRREAGLSQAAVAAKIGVSLDELDALEMAESDPRASTLERLAVALGYHLEWRLERRDA